MAAHVRTLVLLGGDPEGFDPMVMSTLAIPERAKVWRSANGDIAFRLDDSERFYPNWRIVEYREDGIPAKLPPPADSSKKGASP